MNPTFRILPVLENKKLGPYYKITFEDKQISRSAECGNFVMVGLRALDPYLPRPFSFMDERMSYLTHLECAECGKTHPPDVLQNICGCGGTLFARYNLEQMRREIMRDEISAGPASLWRYASVLPVQDSKKILSQGEGWTPMLRARGIERSLGCETLFIKNEGTNPTGTFKDRGTSVALTRAGELDAPTVILNSSGNAGISWAAYAAQAGIPCVTVLPFDAPPSTVRFCRNMGARVFEARGPWAEAGPMVQKAAEKNGWFVPVSVLLDHIRKERGHHELTPPERRGLERKWLLHKVLVGTT